MQFSFRAEQQNDSLVLLTVKAKINPSTQLFSIKKQGIDDPFVSSLFLDTASEPLLQLSDSIIEKGQLQMVVDKLANTSYRLFADSVSFQYQLYIKGYSKKITHKTAYYSL